MNRMLLIFIAIILSKAVVSQEIIFSSNVGGPFDLYVLNIKSGKVEKIASSDARDFQSDYSPINHKLIFDSYRNNNARNLYTYDLVNKDIQQLTNLTTRDGHPAWSPNGAKIAFQSSRNGNPDVFIMDSNGQNIRPITSFEGFDGIPKWSHNGDYIAYNSNKTGSPEVYIYSLKDKNAEQITFNSNRAFIQDWLSNEDLLVISTIDGISQLFSLNLKSKEMTQLETEFDVTYARINGSNSIVFTQGKSGEYNQVYILNTETGITKKLTEMDGEKRFPAFINRNK